ncbi:MAG: methyltransferase domain-containing protein [Solirubrobacteraceae bacterium]
MPDDGLADAKAAAMRWNTPLSEAHAELLLSRLELPPRGSVLDLGCGWGELLIRAVSATGEAGVTGIGVDTYAPDLERGRRAADERGLGDRVSFVQASAVGWSEPADRVLCIGATHAWGGTEAALGALVEAVKPGGLLMFGDGFWVREPGKAAVEIFGEQVVGLGDLVRLAHSAGWQVRHLSEADQFEWDDFESTWRLGRHRWLAEHPNAPEFPKLREELEERVLEYLDVYRGVLGFCYLVLGR